MMSMKEQFLCAFFQLCLTIMTMMMMNMMNMMNTFCVMLSPSSSPPSASSSFPCWVSSMIETLKREFKLVTIFLWLAPAK